MPQRNPLASTAVFPPAGTGFFQPAIMLVVALLLIRLAFLLLSPHSLSGDAFPYLQAAETIAGTGRLPPLYAQPRGYPVLIALAIMATGSADAAAYFIVKAQAAMDTAVVAALVYLAWNRLGRHPKMRLAACALLCLQPFTATMATSLYTEQATQFLFFFGLLALSFGNTEGYSRVLHVAGLLMLGFASTMRVDILPLSAAAIGVLALAERRNVGRIFKQLAARIALLALIPLAITAFQYHSTSEIGLVKPQFYNAGFMSWMRTWFATEDEYAKFAFNLGNKDWPGFMIDNYPDRAFGSPQEKQEVAVLAERWRAAGYSDAIDAGFAAIAAGRRNAHPAHNFLAVPLARMAHFWINKDGAQTILRTLHLRPPASTAVVGAVLLLKMAMLALAATGALSTLRSIGRRKGGPADLGTLSASMALLRTLELGILGMFAWAGLMEVRYVLVAYPFLLLAAVFGLAALLRWNWDWVKMPPPAPQP